MKLKIYLLMAVCIGAGSSLSVHGMKREYSAIVESGLEEQNQKLFEAAERKNFRLIEELLREGVPVDSVNAEGDTLLHRAVRARDEQLLRLTVSHGIAVNKRNNNGDTALNLVVNMEANENTNDIVRFLLLRRANPTIINNGGMNAIIATTFQLSAALQIYAKDQKRDNIMQAHHYHMRLTEFSRVVSRPERQHVMRTLGMLKGMTCSTAQANSVITSYNSVIRSIKK